LSERARVFAAGIASLLLTLGIARFAYTPLLPLMLEQTDLNISGGGWLAAFNYTGYLIGALIASRVRELRTKDRLYRLYLLLAVATTALMAWTENIWLWAFLRLLSGMSSSGGMLLASALILNWLMRHRHRAELGIHFMGIGAGIALVALAVIWMQSLQYDWGLQWELLGAVGLVLAYIAWVWMPRPKAVAEASDQVLIDNPPAPRLERLLLISYFFAGIGYVVSATFIVDLVERQPGLQGQGAIAFALVGLGALPAVLFWDRLARKLGYFTALMSAYLVQIVGILLPLQGSLFAAVFGAFIFGATFIGIVSLVLTLSGRFYPRSPARLMGKMTLAYGVAQIIAPAITGELTEYLGSYYWGIGLAAFAVLVGSLINARLIPLEQNEPALNPVK